MKIALGSDHAGFAFKEKTKRMLEELGHEVVDFGTDSDNPVPYPRFIRPTAEAVAEGTCERGIVFGGSGNGEAIVANKVRGVRCAYAWNSQTAELGRRHNDCNMISIGQRMISEYIMLELVRIFINTPFDGGRHEDRVKEIEDLS